MSRCTISNMYVPTANENHPAIFCADKWSSVVKMLPVSPYPRADAFTKPREMALFRSAYTYSSTANKLTSNFIM